MEVEEPSLVVVGAAAFAAVEEASAEPLLGDKDGTILAAGGSATWYGDGGAGKTTLGLDQAVHLCAGRDWLTLKVQRRCRVLWIENEGPAWEVPREAAQEACRVGRAGRGRLAVRA